MTEKETCDRQALEVAPAGLRPAGAGVGSWDRWDEAAGSLLAFMSFERMKNARLPSEREQVLHDLTQGG